MTFGSWSSTSVFRDVPRKGPKCVCICGTKRISSNLERVPIREDSNLLNSRDYILMTLPSISSETCVISSSIILGTEVFRDRLFLGCYSCVSLGSTANIHFFLCVAFFERKSSRQLQILNYDLFSKELKSTTECNFFRWKTSVNY